MKLYLDEHIQPLLAHFLISRGIDCLTTQTAGNVSHSDEEQLAFATSQERVIVTFDRKDFLSLAQQRGGSGNSDSVISGSLASPKSPSGGEPEERGHEKNTTESWGHV
jgi:hypothetical protein